MSWLSTIFTAVVSAAIATVVSGYFAGLAVGWYRISGFEGGSGYFQVGLALCGLIAGFIIGVIVARIVAGSAHPSVFWALLYSTVIVLCAVSATGGIARLLADIPPTIDGETLMLHVEARWPASRTESPQKTRGAAYLDLGADTFLRKPESQHGALWKEDARLVDGRWTVNGAVPMFTSRGRPLIDIALNDKEETYFTLPSLAHPTAADSAWSKWYPTEGKGGPTRDSGLTYRYRVEKLSVPVRTEIIGDFAVGAVVSYFKPGAASYMSTSDFYGWFEITFNGKPAAVSGASDQKNSYGSVASVALLPGVEPLLLVAGNGTWTILSSENGVLRAQAVSDGTRTDPRELTNDAQRMKEMREHRDPSGRVDRTTYARSHMLLFDHAVLNVDTREVFPFTAKTEWSVIPSVPPLGVSPDEHSFVRFALANPPVNGEYPPLLAVTDFVRDTMYELPIDTTRTPLGNLDRLNSDWLSNNFIWKRDAKGIDRLVPRGDDE